MTTPVQIGERARDRANFRRCFETGAAVFLHNDGCFAHYSEKYSQGVLRASTNKLRHARLKAFIGRPVGVGSKASASKATNNHRRSTPLAFEVALSRAATEASARACARSASAAS